ncbi:hypothetical protein ACFX13_022647 [Malus domestica]
MGSYASLADVNFSLNQFSGSVPAGIWSSSRLRSLDFSDDLLNGHYSEREAVKLIKTIVGVVEACHSLGVMYRDLTMRWPGSRTATGTHGTEEINEDDVDFFVVSQKGNAPHGGGGRV